jgi:hypothetical protein
MTDDGDDYTYLQEDIREGIYDLMVFSTPIRSDDILTQPGDKCENLSRHINKIRNEHPNFFSLNEYEYLFQRYECSGLQLMLEKERIEAREQRVIKNMMLYES